MCLAKSHFSILKKKKSVRDVTCLKELQRQLIKNVYAGEDDDEDLGHLLVTDLRRLYWCFGLSLADNYHPIPNT